MRLILGIVAALLLSAPVLAADKVPSAANNKMKECAANWQTMKTENKTNGLDYKTYSTSCLKGEVPAADSQKNKMKSCADQWNKMKETNTTKGQSYKEFSAQCLKK